jgi:hypothetical protein
MNLELRNYSNDVESTPDQRMSTHIYDVGFKGEPPHLSMTEALSKRDAERPELADVDTT